MLTSRHCALAQCHLLETEKDHEKKVGDKDFTELSGELSGAICLKAIVLLGNALELFRRFFDDVCWLYESCFAQGQAQQQQQKLAMSLAS